MVIKQYPKLWTSHWDVYLFENEKEHGTITNYLKHGQLSKMTDCVSKELMRSTAQMGKYLQLAVSHVVHKFGLYSKVSIVEREV